MAAIRPAHRKIGCRRESGKAAEFPNEMRLVVVAVVGGDLCPVHIGHLPDTSQHTLKPGNAQIGFGRKPHFIGEQRDETPMADFRFAR